MDQVRNAYKFEKDQSHFVHIYFLSSFKITLVFYINFKLKQIRIRLQYKINDIHCDDNDCTVELIYVH